MGEATQDRGMASHALNVIIVKSFVNTLCSVEHLSVIELKRRLTTLKKEVKKMESCCWLIRTMQKVKIIHGTLIPVQAIICVEKKSMFVELHELVSGNVTFGDDLKVAMKGRGNILIRLKNGEYQVISIVYYVPNMKAIS